MSKRLVWIVLMGAMAIVSTYAFFRRPWDRDKEVEHHVILSERYFHEGEHEKAMAELKLALQKDPSYHIARIGLADLYNLHERLDEAIALYDEGLRLYPEQIRFYYEKATLLYPTKRMKEVPQLCREYLQRSPNDREVLLMLGLSLEKLRRWKEAHEVWQHCSQLYPQDPNFQRRLHRVEGKMEK